MPDGWVQQHTQFRNESIISTPLGGPAISLSITIRSFKYSGWRMRSVPARLGVKLLCRTLPDKEFAARADGFAIGTPLDEGDMGMEEPQAVLAVAELVFLLQLIAASGTDESTPSLRVTNIEPITAYPAFIHLDVTITVIDHIPETTLVAYHSFPPHRSNYESVLVLIARPTQK